MKYILPIILVSILAMSCQKPKMETVPVTPETPVTKKVQFEIYAAKDYSDPSYDQTFAEVSLTLYKSNKQDFTTSTIWDTTIHYQQLKLYPQVAQKISIVKEVPITESQEILRASKIIRYTYNNMPSMEGSNEPLNTRENFKLITVAF